MRVVRVRNEQEIGLLARLLAAISGAGGSVGTLQLLTDTSQHVVRDITVYAEDEAHFERVLAAMRANPGTVIVEVRDEVLELHQKGKIAVRSRYQIDSMTTLRRVYTPGVAEVCRKIAADPSSARLYTSISHMVAIVTDGTAVLGLGDIGPEAALPVMEGKAMIFKEFADIDAFPLALRTKDPDEIVATVRNIATPFGGINLEDISAPRCFDIESRLRKELDVPVIHDDQHGTAVVVLGALINVGRLLKRDIRKYRVVMAGAGAAGSATAKILLAYGLKDITVCDRYGAVYPGRKQGMDRHLTALAKETNPRKIKGTLAAAMAGADVFIGLSAPNIVTAGDIRTMAKHPVVFALANPDPEIAPEEALPLVKVLATGRSDYPNQINNMLSYPGIFRGLLDVHARGVNEQVKLAAAEAIAHMVKAEELHEDYIIPSIFEKRVVHAVAHAVAAAARKTGLAER